MQEGLAIQLLGNNVTILLYQNDPNYVKENVWMPIKSMLRTPLWAILSTRRVTLKSFNINK
jgi:hypothetical protein